MTKLPEGWKIHWQRKDISKPFFPITVVEGNDEPYNHETFGPVFTLLKAENEELNRTLKRETEEL